jgi:3-methylcrotonyl-CoA carboxylase alpha subunit
MISKLIVHGANRKQANEKLVAALKGYQIAGVPTNIGFMIKCAEHVVFQEAGAINTGFLEEFAEDVSIAEDSVEPSSQSKALAAFAVLLQLENRIGIQDLTTARQSSNPWSSLTGSWRMGGRQGRRKLDLKLSDKDDALECWSNPDGSFDIGVPSVNNGMEYFTVSGVLDANCQMNAIVNGSKRISATVAMNSHIEHGIINVQLWLDGPGEEYDIAIKVNNPLVPIAHEAESAASSHGIVKAPMPGKIVRINATVGETVRAGDVVIVMEAMKMEHSIKAPRDGTVAELHYNVGDIVSDQAALALVDDDGMDEALA